MFLVVATVVGMLVPPTISGLGVLTRTQAASTTSPPTQITTGWLNQELALWQGATPYPMNFSVQFTSASYTNINHYNLTALEANLNMLYSTNADMVRIDIGYAPWLSSDQTRIGLMTSLVNNISSSKKIFVIADAASSSYATNPLPWTQFQAAWIQRVKTLAALYHPAYYIVVKEPGWYVPYVSDATTNPQFQNASSWLALTQELVSAVQQVSPDTRIGVSVAASDIANQSNLYTPYLLGLENMSGISFLGFDIYNIPGFTNTQQFLQQYGSGGKSIWIAEAWSGTAGVALNSTRSSLDTLWMQTLYYFALEIHAQVISPFFTDIFSSYDAPPTTSQGLITYFQSRTPVFYEFQNVVAQNSEITTSNIATTTTSSTTTRVTSSVPTTVRSSTQNVTSETTNSSFIQSSSTTTQSASSTTSTSHPVSTATTTTRTVSTSTQSRSTSIITTSTISTTSGTSSVQIGPQRAQTSYGYLLAGIIVAILIVFVAVTLFIRRKSSRQHRDII